MKRSSFPKYLIYLLLGSVLTLNNACKKDDNDNNDNGITTADLAGTWLRGDEATGDYLKFSGDTAYSYSRTGIHIEDGSFTLADGMLTLHQTWTLVCFADTAAPKYSIGITNNHLTLTKISDACDYRSTVLELSTYIKK